MKKEKEIAGIIAEQLGVNEAKVFSSKNLIDELGADSADMVNIFDAIEKIEKIEIKEIWTPLMINLKSIINVVNLIKKGQEAELERLLGEISETEKR